MASTCLEVKSFLQPIDIYKTSFMLVFQKALKFELILPPAITFESNLMEGMQGNEK